MGMTDKNLWILIRYYNYKESDQNNIESLLRQVTLPSVFTFTELKSAIYSWANIKENQSHVIKLRRYDNSLVPLSALFQGSSKEKPFLMDVVKFHQFCTANIQSVSPDYTSIFKSKLEDLEKRVVAIETAIPDLAVNQIRTVQNAVDKLANCVAYLDRRLEELAPADWKSQLDCEN
ncbi:uncharacterized protein LOC107982113 isoform X6 [Nasonia vitripennis]|uniref:Uncharacterized protein n=1 Tax=Nasonia vitripennis TaxID=7425 RepID=A0A7M7TBB4_NASVI|nr:uncharacterized protein LOC107982113 isoform X6 [Nasonia vitripennis]